MMKGYGTLLLALSFWVIACGPARNARTTPERDASTTASVEREVLETARGYKPTDQLNFPDEEGDLMYGGKVIVAGSDIEIPNVDIYIFSYNETTGEISPVSYGFTDVEGFFTALPAVQSNQTYYLAAIPGLEEDHEATVVRLNPAAPGGEDVIVELKEK